MTLVSPVTIAEAKAHLRIETPEEDALIGSYLLAASQFFEKETGTLLVDPVPQLVKQAILLIVGTWFENREAASALTIKSVPFAVEAIVAQFAKPEAC